MRTDNVKRKKWNKEKPLKFKLLVSGVVIQCRMMK